MLSLTTFKIIREDANLPDEEEEEWYVYIQIKGVEGLGTIHGLRTSNEGINQRNLKFWADVADKICFGCIYKFGIVYVVKGLSSKPSENCIVAPIF